MEIVAEYQGKPNLEQFATILDSTQVESMVIVCWLLKTIVWGYPF
jgi:hypothetical protein